MVAPGVDGRPPKCASRLNPDAIQCNDGPGDWERGRTRRTSQAVIEHVVFSEEGQLLSGSYMDYCLPHADDLPSFEAINLDALMVQDRDGVELQFGGIGDSIIFSISQMVDPADPEIETCVCAADPFCSSSITRLRGPPRPCSATSWPRRSASTTSSSPR